MSQYVKIISSSIIFAFLTLPTYVSAASITETSAAIGEGCVASGNHSTAMGYGTVANGPISTSAGGYTKAGAAYSFAGGTYMQLTSAALHTFVWGHSTTAKSISSPNAFLIFPAGTTGQVGIGTKSPKNLLDLGATQGKKLAFFQKTTGEDFYGFGISSATLEIYAGVLSDDANPAMVVKKSTKRIGIGTKDPGYLLEVNGDAAKTSGGTTWINSSDVRLKDITGEYQRDWRKS